MFQACVLLAAILVGPGGCLVDVDPGTRNSRADDTNPYDAIAARHTQQIDALTAKVQALENALAKAQQKVAFVAHFSQNEISGLSPGQLVIFDSIELNIGNAYNRANGIFTAPFAGTYVFFVKVLSWINYSINLSIYTGSNHLVTAAEVFAHPKRHMASAQSVVHLSKGQTVFVKARPTENSDNTESFGSTFTSFSGFLLYSD